MEDKDAANARKYYHSTASEVPVWHPIPVQDSFFLAIILLNMPMRPVFLMRRAVFSPRRS